jgi:hypothetical protein
VRRDRNPTFAVHSPPAVEGKSSAYLEGGLLESLPDLTTYSGFPHFLPQVGQVRIGLETGLPIQFPQAFAVANR